MKVSSNKISDVFKYYLKPLEELFGLNEAKSFMYNLFEHFLDVNRLDVAKDPDICLSESELLKIHFAVKELLKNKPIQHIIGSTSFCDLEFKVTPEVLIPRPETEELVELIVNEFENLNQSVSILDIGTGSGCIAISLAKKISRSLVYAIDISEAALKVAVENAKINTAKVNFSSVDILDNMETSALPKFNVIVSNPPYIRNSEKSLMQKNVLDYEPESALFVLDEDPLVFYQAIAALGQAHLNDNGRIYFEINEAFGNETSELLKRHKFSNIKIHKDFRGKDRFVSAILTK